MSHAAPAYCLVPDVVLPDAEATLVRRAQDRDPHAFAAVYRAHVGRVYALCRRMTGNASFAEELTQQVFVTAWEKLPAFRGEGAFGGWLHHLAVNTVLAALRARSRLHARVVFTSDPAAHENPPAPPSTAARLDLEQAIAALPTQARAIFVLHDIEGWSHAEIATQLELAIGTTKAQLHRARQLLQEALR